MLNNGNGDEETGDARTSTTSSISTPAHKKLLLKQQQEYNELGRLRNDTEGEEPPWGERLSKAGEVCGFFAGGFLCVAADATHSYCTGKPRGIGDEKPLKPGTNYLKSIALVAQLSSSTDADGDDDNIKSFLNRYYRNCKIFDPNIRGEALNTELDKLMNQLYEDISNRNARKTAGDRLILWAATFLAASVSLISFVRNIIHNQNGASSTNANLAINYAEGGGALFVLILTQVTNRKTQADDQAAQALIKVRRWAKTYVQERRKKDLPITSVSRANTTPLFMQKTPAVPFSARERMPIEDALYDQRYIIDHQVNNLNHPLFEAVAKLRSALGIPTTLSNVHTQLNAFLNEASGEAKPLLKTQASAHDLEAQSTDSLETIKHLAKLYDCPIFIIHETKQANESYCTIINETAPTDAEEKDGEEDPVAYREARAMILYSTGPDDYKPVKQGISGRPLGAIKAELMALKPTEHSANEHVDEEKTKDHLAV